MSRLEVVLAFQLHASGLTPERQYKFDPCRKYRADFAFPERRLIVEVNGGTWMVKSGHSTGTGIQRDYEKANTAQMLGWTYLQFTSKEIYDGSAIKMVEDFMTLRCGTCGAEL